MKIGLVFVLGSLLFACGGGALDGADKVSPIADNPTTKPPAATTERSTILPCAPVGGGCKHSADCCVGSCDSDAYVMTWRTCLAPAADGSYCHEDRGCASGRCQDFTCTAAN
jgi:hypothetical protein